LGLLRPCNTGNMVTGRTLQRGIPNAGENLLAAIASMAGQRNLPQRNSERRRPMARAVEMLKLKTGADLIHVPYRGGSQAAADAISGQIEMVSMGLASARVAEGGKLRILAQTGPNRHPMFADVPTTAEFGLPDVRMDTWFGLIAPPNTPDPVVSQLARAITLVTRGSFLVAWRICGPSSSRWLAPGRMRSPTTPNMRGSWPTTHFDIT